MIKSKSYGWFMFRVVAGRFQGLGDRNCGLRGRSKERERIYEWHGPQMCHHQNTDAD